MKLDVFYMRHFQLEHWRREVQPPKLGTFPNLGVLNIFAMNITDAKHVQTFRREQLGFDLTTNDPVLIQTFPSAAGS